jgi:hypothetical protein
MDYRYDLQYYLDISDGSGTPNYVRVKSDNAFDPSVDRDEYSPSYKSAKNSPTYSKGKKTKVDVNLDCESEDDTLHAWFVSHEDDDNVPTRMIRVWVTKGASGARTAKMAECIWNGNPLDGDADSPLNITGTLSMKSSEWTPGTFDESTSTFTEAE